MHERTRPFMHLLYVVFVSEGISMATLTWPILTLSRLHPHALSNPDCLVSFRLGPYRHTPRKWHLHPCPNTFVPSSHTDPSPRHRSPLHLRAQRRRLQDVQALRLNLGQQRSPLQRRDQHRFNPSQAPGHETRSNPS